MQSLKIWIIVVSCALINAQVNLCSSNNGNCDSTSQCLYRTGSSVQCGCPCGTTPSPTQSPSSCIFSPSCDLDIYFLLDTSKYVDISPCGDYKIPIPRDFRAWNLWKSNMVNILEKFKNNKANTTNIGIQEYFDKTGQSLTTANYTDPLSLTEAIMNLTGRRTPHCSFQLGDTYVDNLYHAGDVGNDINIPNNVLIFSPWGPFKLRPRDKTTRIAIVFFSNYIRAPLTDNDLLLIRQSILRSFDQIIFIKRVQLMAVNEARTTQTCRLMACGNATAPCKNCFWIDRVNDFGYTLSYSAIQKAIEPKACLANSVANLTANPVYTISCDNKMVIEVKLCHLRGMNASDLVFNNNSCDVSNYATFSPDGLTMILTLKYNECGMTSTYNNVTLEYEHGQSLKTKFFSTAQNLLNVNLQAKCKTFPLKGTASVDIKPAADIVSGNITERGHYDLSMTLFTTSAFITPTIAFLGGYQAIVGCKVYVEATSVIPVNLFLHLTSCWASPSNDASVKYQLAADSCAKDPTFQWHPSSKNNTVRFSFEMFEFAATFNTLEIFKPRVNIYCQFAICKDKNSSAACSDCQTGRKRRFTDTEDAKTVTKFVGPLYIQKKKESQTHKDGQINRADKQILKKPIDSNSMESNQFYKIIISKFSNQWSDFSNIYYAMVGILFLLVIGYSLTMINRRVKKAYESANELESCVHKSLNYPPPYVTSNEMK